MVKSAFREVVQSNTPLHSPPSSMITVLFLLKVAAVFSLAV